MVQIFSQNRNSAQTLTPEAIAQLRKSVFNKYLGDGNFKIPHINWKIWDCRREEKELLVKIEKGVLSQPGFYSSEIKMDGIYGHEQVTAVRVLGNFLIEYPQYNLANFKCRVYTSKELHTVGQDKRPDYFLIIYGVLLQDMDREKPACVVMRNSTYQYLNTGYPISALSTDSLLKENGFALVVSFHSKTDDMAEGVAKFLEGIGVQNVGASRHGQKPAKRNTPHTREKIFLLEEQVRELKRETESLSRKLQETNGDLANTRQARDEYCQRASKNHTAATELAKTIGEISRKASIKKMKGPTIKAIISDAGQAADKHKDFFDKQR